MQEEVESRSDPKYFLGLQEYSGQQKIQTAGVGDSEYVSPAR